MPRKGEINVDNCMNSWNSCTQDYTGRWNHGSSNNSTKSTKSNSSWSVSNVTSSIGGWLTK